MHKYASDTHRMQERSSHGCRLLDGNAATGRSMMGRTIRTNSTMTSFAFMFDTCDLPHRW